MAIVLTLSLFFVLQRHDPWELVLQANSADELAAQADKLGDDVMAMMLEMALEPELPDLPGSATFTESGLIANLHQGFLRLLQPGSDEALQEWAMAVEGDLSFFDDDAGIAMIETEHGALRAVSVDQGAAVGLLPGRIGLMARHSFTADWILRSWQREVDHGHPLHRVRHHGLEIWDRRTLEPVAFLGGCTEGFVTPDGKSVVGRASGDCLGIWDIRSGRELFRRRIDGLYRLQVAGDSSVLAFKMPYRLTWNDTTQQMMVEGWPVVELWLRRRPEWWWGHLLRLEVWTAAGALAGWVAFSLIAGVGRTSRAADGASESRNLSIT